MANEDAPRTVAAQPIVDVKFKLKTEAIRRHVLNRLTQEKSARLSCNDESEIEIPTIDLYAAR